MSLEVADFGQMSTTTEDVDVNDVKSHWTDRLGLSTECRSTDVSFFVEIFLNSNENIKNEEEDSLRLCLRKFAQVCSHFKQRVATYCLHVRLLHCGAFWKLVDQNKIKTSKCTTMQQTHVLTVMWQCGFKGHSNNT